MRRHLSAVVVALASSLATVVFLTRCSVPSASAGGTSDGGSGAFHSGSRLKMRTLVSDDGASQFLGWYDSQLQQECAPETIVPGDVRCLPKHQVIQPGIARYADAECKRLVLTDTKEEEVRDLLFVRPDSAIARLGQCFVQSGTAPLLPKTYRIDSSGACYDLLRTSGSYCELGEIVPRETFAQLKTITAD